MTAARQSGLTVGNLVGVPLGSAPGPSADAPETRAAGAPVDEAEGPNWIVRGGDVARGGRVDWRSDGVEALDFNNPFGQVMERVWFDGKVCYAVDLGEVVVDPSLVKVAQEYQIVYAVQLDAAGRLIGAPEAVPEQLNIYDTVPGMEGYSPIWQFNYVVVPRGYAPNTLRSEKDCLNSGYQILRSQVFEN
jgi:hypothetical protein